jgi:hypothetical protein
MDSAAIARGRVVAVLLAVGSIAGSLAAACASGTEVDSPDDAGDGGDGTLSDDGPGSEGGYADRGGRDVVTVTCTPSGPPTTCAAPTNLGSLMPTQTTTSTGNLVTAGEDAYLTVTFNGNTSEDYHPSIALTKGASEFVFDVFSDCNSTTLTCGDQDGGPSTGVTTWEVQYTGGDFNSDAAAGTDGAFDPIPPVGAMGTVFVHLYRKSGLPVSCNDYTLTVGN